MSFIQRIAEMTMKRKMPLLFTQALQILPAESDGVSLRTDTTGRVNLMPVFDQTVRVARSESPKSSRQAFVPSVDHRLPQDPSYLRPATPNSSTRSLHSPPRVDYAATPLTAIFLLRFRYYMRPTQLFTTTTTTTSIAISTQSKAYGSFTLCSN